MVRYVSFGNSTKGINHEITLTFRQDEQSDTSKTFYMRYHLIPGDVTSERSAVNTTSSVVWKAVNYTSNSTRTFMSGSTRTPPLKRPGIA